MTNRDLKSDPERALSSADIRELSMPSLQKITPHSVVDGIHTLSDLIKAIKAEAFFGLEEYCQIPKAYTKCALTYEFKNVSSLSDHDASQMIQSPSGAVINPYPVHLDCINLFQNVLGHSSMFCRDSDPLKPTFGAYLFGPPGTAKTHLMAAFAIQMRKYLDGRLDSAFAGVDTMVKQYYGEYRKEVDKGGAVNTGHNMRWEISDKPGSEQIRVAVNPADRFAQKCEELKTRMLGFPIKPTDILYLSFDALCKIYEDRQQRLRSIDAIERTPIVFIDDLYIGEDQPERLEIAQTLIENRLANDRIATYITSNVSPKELLKNGSVLNQRLMSRCSELYIPLDFSDIPDWRESVRARKNRVLMAEVQSKTDSQIELLAAKAHEAGLGENWGKRAVALPN